MVRECLDDMRAADTGRRRWAGTRMRDARVLCLRACLLAVVTMTLANCIFEVIIPPSPTEVAFRSSHGLYVTAMGEDDGWVLRQESQFSACGRFFVEHLANGEVTLKTCHDRYVTAPESGDTRRDWLLWQEGDPDRCAQFERCDLGSDRVALKTCAERFLTAGDGGWDPGLEWSIVGETRNLEAWEIFTILEDP